MDSTRFKRQLLAAAGIALWLWSGAQADFVYFLEKSFAYTQRDPIATEKVNSLQYDHAYARSGAVEMRAVEPEGQAPNWNPTGGDYWDRFTRQVLNRPLIGGVGGHPVKMHSDLAAPATGLNMGYLAEVPPIPTSTAYAASLAKFNPYSGSRHITGSMTVGGVGTPGPDSNGKFPGIVYGFSFVGIEVAGHLYSGVTGHGYDSTKLRGSIQKEGKLRPYNDFDRYLKWTDPWTFELYDPVTRELLFGDTMFESEFTLFGPTDESAMTAASINWENGMLDLTADDAAIHIRLNERYTVPSGALDLEVHGGVVTLSSDSGIFEGFLPAEGTPGPLHLALPNELSFDYDLSEFIGMGDVELVIRNDCSDRGYDAVVPEPTVIGLLVLGGLPFIARRRRMGMSRGQTAGTERRVVAVDHKANRL